jgi:hypothetical protein
VEIKDTTYYDPEKLVDWFSWFNPDRPRDSLFEVLNIRTLNYFRALPVAPDPLPIRLHGFREWKTGPAHLNGVVDVVFDDWFSDSTVTGKPATFNPTMQTCSAILCHGDLGDYRWAAPSKSLPPLRGVYPDSL